MTAFAIDTIANDQDAGDRRTDGAAAADRVWNAERVAALRKYWEDDGYSASQIARVLGHGITRNAVLGKADRLKLVGRHSTGTHRSDPRAKTKRLPSTSNRGLGFRVAKAREQARASGEPVTSAAAAIMAERAPAADPSADLAPLKGDAWTALPGTTPVSVEAHKEGQCRWPIGEPVIVGFCGCPVHAKSANYCLTHQSRIGSVVPAGSVVTAKRSRVTGAYGVLLKQAMAL